MKVDPRFLTADGPEIFNGNELLIKGALEAEGGTHLLGGYPGSPAAAFFDAMAHIKDLLVEKGIRAIINSNEALSAAMLNGSQLVGARGMIVMKSVGVHVAADGLAMGNLAGAHPNGGAIVVYGDDPWCDSTQSPSDSRFISKHLFMPVIEPSTPQEVKDYVDLAFRLSRTAELYAGFMLPTNLADGGGSVQCRPNQYPAFNMNQRLTLDTSEIDPARYVLLPPNTWTQEARLPARLAKAMATAASLGLNRLEYANNAATRKPLGFITSGMAYGYLRQALWEMGLLGTHPILKLGMSYPVDAELVRQLARQCERIVVVEERRSFIEEQIAAVILSDRQQGLPTGNVDLWGKQFPAGMQGFPETRGLHPSIVIERLVPLLGGLSKGSFSPATADVLSGDLPTASGATLTDESDSIAALAREQQTIDLTAQLEVGHLPARTPTFCPGCPHRDSSNLCLEIKKRFMDEAYMRRTHGRGATDLLFHGDAGCYVMLMYPPTAPLMHNYSGMGLGGGTGSGTDPFITNKQIVFMGDGTFFHSGQIAISQAIKLGQDITFMVLDNSTTAMTGHQPTPGVDYDVIGSATPVQDIQEVISGMAGTSNLTVVRADPEKREQYVELLERTFLADGVKVVIATKECGITRGRRRRRVERAEIKQRGFLASWEHMNINAELCRFCLACSEYTGCPGLKHVDTEYGRKMDTDISWCVNDGACERIGACHAFEHVTIRRKKPIKSRLPELGLEDIPEPAKRPHDDLWRCVLTGVGGMGIGVATSILVRAGHKQGYDVIFLDKKGLAIRNGGVTSQVVYNISRQPITAVVPYGKADLLLGVDILEAARMLDPRGRGRVASSEKTAAVINTDRIQTIRSLVGDEADFDPAALEKLIRQYTRGDDFLARNISRICEKYLGNKLYANIMMLGFAFQKGLIPVSMHSMAWAIKDTIRTDFRKNLYAFNMGRKLVVQSDLFQGPPPRRDWREVLEEKCRFTIRRYGGSGTKLADALRELAADSIGSMEKLDDADKRAVVVRLYDCLRWGSIDYAARYAQAVRDIYSRDLPGQAYAATKAVIHNLAGAMLVQDPVFIAELATSPEKYARDREKYNVNVSHGDKIVYRHLMHPTLKFGPWTWSPDLAVGDFTLKVLKRMRWLRKILPAPRAQQQFLAKYRKLASEFTYADAAEYRRKVLALSSPHCMDCVNPRCSEVGCPLSARVPECIQLAYEDRWADACMVLHERNNFPEFTSRICPGFCQDACKQGLTGYSVKFKEMEYQIVDRGFAEGWIRPQPPAAKTGKKVAVVGAGPAGLAAAQQLARAGHDVTVFEKDSAPGGLLRFGIPAFRLDKALIDRRLDQLRAEGVTFRTGVQVGKETGAEQLRKEFDAVLLTVGASRPRDLKAPGRELAGVHYALDFLRGASPSISAKGKSVVVIGGGLTGEDCVETALMQGATQVHQFEILPAAPAKASGHMDEDPDNLIRRYGVATQAFAGNGSLRQVRASQVRWTSSAHGPVKQDVANSEFTVNADLALLAMGFEKAIDPAIAAQLKLSTDSRGCLVLDRHATSAAGVFAAGDLVSGSAYVATAIDSGRSAAEQIDEYLKR